jgi:hypothetical protein
VGLGGRGFIVIGVLHIQLCQLPYKVMFLLSRHLFVSPLDVLLLLGLRESRCWTSILGTVMLDSSEPAVAMASLMRWPTNDNDKEEDKLNYAPLPHLLSFLLSSPSSPPRSLFSCPALFALPVMRRRQCHCSRGGHHRRRCRGPQRGCRDHRRHRRCIRAAGGGGRRCTWGATASGDRCARRRCCRPSAPPAWARESRTAALAALRCDGRPPSCLLLPCLRRGQTKGRWARRGTAMAPPPPPWRPRSSPPC